MADGDNRNIFRAAALRHDQRCMIYDHQVEIEAADDLPLTDKAIRRLIEAWISENNIQAAVGEDHTVWFAHETDATLFYLRFS